MDPSKNNFIGLCDDANRYLEGLSADKENSDKLNKIKIDLSTIAFDGSIPYFSLEEAREKVVKVKKAITEATNDPDCSLEAIKLINEVKEEIIKKREENFIKVSRKLIDILDELLDEFNEKGKIEFLPDVEVERIDAKIIEMGLSYPELKEIAEKIHESVDSALSELLGPKGSELQVLSSTKAAFPFFFDAS